MCEQNDQNDQRNAKTAIEAWIEYGEFLIENHFPYAAETIDGFITALDEDGDYSELVSDARSHFEYVFGAYVGV